MMPPFYVGVHYKCAALNVANSNHVRHIESLTERVDELDSKWYRESYMRINDRNKIHTLHQRIINAQKRIDELSARIGELEGAPAIWDGDVTVIVGVP